MVDPQIEKLCHQRREALSSFLNELSGIYGDMDRQYHRIARQYGFECKGCENNCCLTRFYHHTVLEYAFLMAGFNALDDAQKALIQARAVEVLSNYREADLAAGPVRIMCPLNEEGLCQVYERRPMICRLHGLPHELKKASGQKVFGPGCEAFDERCKNPPYIPLDRTPFYARMAGLEQRLRQALGYYDKIKLTLADMVAPSKI
jgi:Fe-S-cluster containining protein